jgi:hypothetical protein
VVLFEVVLLLPVVVGVSFALCVVVVLSSASSSALDGVALSALSIADCPALSTLSGGTCSFPQAATHSNRQNAKTRDNAFFIFLSSKIKKCVQLEVTHTEKRITSICYHTKFTTSYRRRGNRSMHFYRNKNATPAKCLIEFCVVA